MAGLPCRARVKPGGTVYPARPGRSDTGILARPRERMGSSATRALKSPRGYGTWRPSTALPALPEPQCISLVLLGPRTRTAAAGPRLAPPPSLCHWRTLAPRPGIGPLRLANAGDPERQAASRGRAGQGGTV